MERDYFIIKVYCLVHDFYQNHYAHQRLRQRGRKPSLTDPEVITMEICGEYLGFYQDEDLYDYFYSHYHHFSPTLPTRTTFIRQAANLSQVKQQFHSYLVNTSGQADDPYQIIDTMPLPICTYTRAQRDRCFKPIADYGYCAAKQLHYYGFKLGLRISRCGMITHFPLLPARPHDSQLLDDLISGHQGVIIGDKAFINQWRQEQLATKRHIELVTGSRKNMTHQLPKPLRKLVGKWRKLVETVGSHLSQRFHITLTRARDLWHYQNRLIRKVLSHTVCVFINLQMGRSPLHLDDLVTVSKIAH